MSFFDSKIAASYEVIHFYKGKEIIFSHFARTSKRSRVYSGSEIFLFM